MEVQWSSWASLGKPQETEIARPFAQRNQDGRLEVFALGLGGIFNISQVFPNGGWRDSWRSKDRPSPNVRIRSHVVSRNADGRQEIFAVGDDDGLWQKWQVAPNNGWSEWKTLGTPARDVSLTDPVRRREKSGWPARSVCRWTRRERLADLADSTERRLEQLGNAGKTARDPAL
jgi:hypothetical protein